MTRRKTKHFIRRRAVYRSSIPATATEVVTSRHPDGTKKAADYCVNGETVGFRCWDEDGQLEMEWAFQSDGERHGYEYEFAPNGQMTFKSRWVDGREHGTARQWDDKGRLLMTYNMRHGVGLDLWCDNISGKLSEERYFPDDNQL